MKKVESRIYSLPLAKNRDNISSFFTQVRNEVKFQKLAEHMAPRFFGGSVVCNKRRGGKNFKAYMAMEFLSGQTLHQMMSYLRANDHKKYEYKKRVLKIFLDLAEKTQKLHDKNIIHMDIKLNNIILEGDHKVKVIDFGLAEKTGQSGCVDWECQGGHHHYHPPELYLTSISDRKTIYLPEKVDIYSLGVVLAQFFSGCSRFSDWYAPYEALCEGEKSEDYLNRFWEIVEGRISLCDIPDDGVKDLLKRMLKPYPEDRPELLEVISLVEKTLENMSERRSVRLKKSEYESMVH